MPINDILTQIDLIPGLSDVQRQDAASRVSDGDNSKSKYRRALSRTLSRDDRREQTTTTRAKATAVRQPPAPSTDRNSRPSEEATPVRPNSESQRPAPQRDHGEVTVAARDDQDDSNQLQSIVSHEKTTSTESKTAVLEAEQQTLFNESQVTDFLVDVDERPSPPADLSLLFAPLSEDELPAADTDPLNAISPDDTPLIPPDGLFNSLVNSLKNSAGQQGDPAEQLSNLASSAVASTPEHAHVDVATLHPQQVGIGDFVQPIDVELSERPSETQSGDNVEHGPVNEFGSVNTNANQESASASVVERR